MAWQIGGQVGAAMNTTWRSPETLRMSSGQVEFQSLAADTFRWTSETDDATGAGVVIPDEGQIVQLFKDGDRKFWGVVKKVEPSFTGYDIEVTGPWWWMTRVMLTSTQTDPNGGTAERLKYEFATGQLRGMFQALISRLIANGVPMILGDVAGMYKFVKLTLSNTNGAEALAKLMQRVPDAVAWFDYTGAAGTDPILNISRRNGADAMSTTTFTVGTDRLTMGKIRPRLDLEIKKVRLDYMDRHPTTGRARFQKDVSSTITGDGFTGKLQVVPISGPEIVDFLPKDDFESVSLKTVASVNNNGVARTRDATLSQIAKKYGNPAGGIGTAVTTYTGQTGPGAYQVANTKSFPALAVQRDNGSYITNLAGRFLVVSSDLPEWALKQYGGVKVTVSGTWIATQAGKWTASFEALRAGALAVGAGNFISLTGPYLSWAARAFSYQAVLINTSFPAAKTVYKVSDYDFINPPDGMADGLRSAQNWIPYEGPFSLVADDVTCENRLGRCIHLAGTRAELASMKATVKSMSYDLLRGQINYKLGAPARTTFGTAMGRVPTNPQDVIIQL